MLTLGVHLQDLEKHYTGMSLFIIPHMQMRGFQLSGCAASCNLRWKTWMKFAYGLHHAQTGVCFRLPLQIGGVLSCPFGFRLHHTQKGCPQHV